MSGRPIVLLTNAIHEEAEALLAPHAKLVTAPDTQPNTLRALVGNAHGIVVRAQLPEDILDYAPLLKGIVRHGVGLDFIPVGGATARGIPVANLPGVNAQAVAEYCFAALLQVRRPLALMNHILKYESWNDAREIAPGTTEISGTTLGVVGVGNVGRKLAEIGRLGFGMTVVGASRQPGRMPKGVEEVALDEVFTRSDAIVLACPLTDETRGLVNAKRLSLMKSHAVLINISRGPVVEIEALVEALRGNAIGGAVMDVFDTEPLPREDDLLRCPRLVLTPHVAAITSTSLRKMSIGAAEEMIRILSGKLPDNLVNPDCLAFRTII
ncbi:NAD(P)-dependent oxidoreductase [Stutzerimonas azotifigens]|uniref:NAD(P)-dependent oxidoreductase n=1 Tax=Stutzerimonas azotifigens TaxID=291995 RepID=UPI000A03E384|nr:NAD(P)-dependent oxidoreductase [Stutzerimonas azotifigens]